MGWIKKRLTKGPWGMSESFTVGQGRAARYVNMKINSHRLVASSYPVDNGRMIFQLDLARVHPRLLHRLISFYPFRSLFHAFCKNKNKSKYPARPSRIVKSC